MSDLHREFSISRFTRCPDMITFVDERSLDDETTYAVHEEVILRRHNYFRLEDSETRDTVIIPEYAADAFGCFVDWLYGSDLNRVMTNLSPNTQFVHLIALYEWGFQKKIVRLQDDVMDALQDLIFRYPFFEISLKHVLRMCSFKGWTQQSNFVGALIHYSMERRAGITKEQLTSGTERNAKVLQLWTRWIVENPELRSPSESWHPCRRVVNNKAEGFDPCEFHQHKILDNDEEEIWLCRRSISLSRNVMTALCTRAPDSKAEVGSLRWMVNAPRVV